MSIQELIKRLNEAHKNNSLRKIAKMCGVSHESIRLALSEHASTNLTLKLYSKIDKGLQTNGF